MAADTELISLHGLTEFSEDAKKLFATKQEVAEAKAAAAAAVQKVKVNGSDVALQEGAANITVATGTENGTIAVQGSDVNVKGLLALAFLAQVSESELEDTLKTKINTAVANIATLQGTAETSGSVKNIFTDMIATWAGSETDNSKVDTFKELIKWVEDHDNADEAAKLTAAIAKLEAILAGIGGDSDDQSTVVDYVSAEIETMLEELNVTEDHLDAAVKAKLAKIAVNETGIAKNAADIAALLEYLGIEDLENADGSEEGIVSRLDDAEDRIDTLEKGVGSWTIASDDAIHALLGTPATTQPDPEEEDDDEDPNGEVD